MLIFKHARVVDPFTQTDQILDVCVKDSRIHSVGEDLTVPADAVVIDASGLVLAPGLVDTHVHFRDPGFPAKETIETGAEAAKKGGFTSVICMANTKPAADCVSILQANLNKGEKTGIHVLQATAVTKGMQGKELTDLEELAAAGSAGFTDDGLPILDQALLYEAMERSAKLNMPLSLHEEDPAFLASQGVNQGKVSEALGLGGASALAEEVLVARDCAMALHAGCDLVIQHISSGKSVKIIRAFQAMGAKIHGEATPHHFSLTEDAVLEHGTLARMNPPLRTEEDRLEIIRGLADGTLDLIATDHAPHTAEEKAKPFAQAPSGITGLETSLGLGVTNLVRPGHLTILQLMEKMSANPAKLYHLPMTGIIPGAEADLVLFAPDETFVAGNYASKASNTPFTGKTLYGPVKMTICGGRIVYTGQS